MLREEKQNYAKGGGYILIDDLEKNIKEWDDAGGTGIRFTSAEETLSRIAELDEHSEDK